MGGTYLNFELIFIKGVLLMNSVGYTRQPFSLAFSTTQLHLSHCPLL
jgi:hypothetical protein